MMERIQIEQLYLWQFENLRALQQIAHFVTDRRSAPEGDHFTLSFSSSPDADEIRRNRAKVASSMGVAPERLFFPSQVHETNIVRVTARTPTTELAATDALVTAEAGVGIAVMSADCVPVLLYDTRNRVVAAVHAGWRGTVANITGKTVRKMAEWFGTRPGDIVAGIGPSVCQLSYEVGEEVVTRFRETFPAHVPRILRPADGGGKAFLDLWEANRLQLLDEGVDNGAVEVSNLCTVLNNEHFYSARKGDKGRFAAGIVLR